MGRPSLLMPRLAASVDWPRRVLWQPRRHVWIPCLRSFDPLAALRTIRPLMRLALLRRPFQATHSTTTFIGKRLMSTLDMTL